MGNPAQEYIRVGLARGTTALARLPSPLPPLAAPAAGAADLARHNSLKGKEGVC